MCDERCSDELSLHRFSARNAAVSGGTAHALLHIMNWDRIKGRWREATDQIKSLWGKAIDDDAMSLAGKRQELVGSLQGRVDGAVPSQPKVETTP